jgi:hypothetical protein
VQGGARHQPCGGARPPTQGGAQRQHHLRWGVSSYNEYDNPGGIDVGAHAACVTGDLPSGGPNGHGGDGANRSGNGEERCPSASEWRTTH